jgi:DNA-binding beta-propeller fold protein YncE
MSDASDAALPMTRRQIKPLYVGVAIAAALAAIAAAVLLIGPPRAPDQLPSAQVALASRPPVYQFAIGGPGQSVLLKPMLAIEGPEQSILVADAGGAVVRVFDREGQPLRVIGKPAAGDQPAPGELRYPTGLALDDDQHLYVADPQTGQISMFDLQGQFLGVFGPPVDQRVFARPVSLAYSKGQFWVNDIGNQRVAVVDRQGNLITATEPALLTFANYSALGPRGVLAVADSNNNRVHLFDSALRLTATITQAGDSSLLMPRGIAYDGLGRLHVVSVFRHQVLVFDAGGQFLFAYGERGDQAGQFNFPNGLTISRDRIYIADKENARVQVWQIAVR